MGLFRTLSEDAVDTRAVITDKQLQRTIPRLYKYVEVTFRPALAKHKKSNNKYTMFSIVNSLLVGFRKRS